MTNTSDPTEMRVNRNYGLCALGAAVLAIALLAIMLVFTVTGPAFWALLVAACVDVYFGAIYGINWFRGRNGGVA